MIWIVLLFMIVSFVLFFASFGVLFEWSGLKELEQSEQQLR